MDRLDERGCPVAHRQPLRTAADDAAPDQSERGRADDASSGVPWLTSARLTVIRCGGDEFLGAVERVDQEEAASIR